MLPVFTVNFQWISPYLLFLTFLGVQVKCLYYSEFILSATHIFGLTLVILVSFPGLPLEIFQNSKVHFYPILKALKPFSVKNFCWQTFKTWYYCLIISVCEVDE